MTITILWWHIPTLITVLAFAWAFLWPDRDTGGWLPSFTPLYRIPIALIISLAAWAIAGVLK